MAEVNYRQSSDTTLTMPNGQSLNVLRFTVNNQPWVIYPGKTPADGGTPLYVGTDGTNYQFYTHGPEDGYRLYQYHPAPGSPEDENNLSKSLEVHTRAYGNDKPKKQFGGTMNYTSYLQGGGSMVQTLIEKVMQSQGQDQSALQQLVELAKEGNEEAIAFLQEIQGQSASMKCGGRVKKKALGSKLIKTQKAKCGCELKKVGGRLIEVDSCTGLPIHRNGGQVKKYQNAAGAIQRADDGSYYFKDGPASRTYTAAEAKERLGAVRHNGSYYYRSPEGRIYTLESTPLNWAQSAGWAEMKKNDAGAYVLHPDVLAGLGYQKRENGSWGYGPAPEAQPQAPAPLAPQAPAAPAGQLPPAAPAAPAPTSAGPGLFTGDLRSYGARRQWVTDNAEYLKSQGWDDARIAGYKGSASDNIALLKAISNKSAWDAAREQRLREPIPGEQKLNRISTTLRTPAAPRPYNALPTSAITSWTLLEPKTRNEIKFSLPDLKTVNSADALYLSDTDWNNWLNLQFNR